MTDTSLRLPFKWISPVGSLIALLGFFLVFTEINCNGKSLDTITGIELATGYQQDIDLVQSDTAEEQEKETERYDPNIFALNALLAALLGIILFALPKMRDQHLLHAIVAGIGFASMIGLMVNLKSELMQAQNDSGSTVNIDLDLTFEMKPGFWLVTACFLITLVADIMLYRARTSTKTPSGETPVS